MRQNPDSQKQTKTLTRSKSVLKLPQLWKKQIAALLFPAALDVNGVYHHVSSVWSEHGTDLPSSFSGCVAVEDRGHRALRRPSNGPLSCLALSNSLRTTPTAMACVPCTSSDAATFV